MPISPQQSKSIAPAAAAQLGAKADAVVPSWTAEALASRLGGRWAIPPDQGWVGRRVRWISNPEKINYGNINIIPVRPAQKVRNWFSPDPRTAGCLILAEESYRRDFKCNVPVLLVGKALDALRDLAVASRERVKGTIIVVTGTVGKTTTQKMLVNMLRGFGSIVANNRNMRLEAFEDLANANPDADYLLFELGMGEYRNSLGQVTSVLKPHAGVLTQVGMAHMDIFPKSASDTEILHLVLEEKLQIFSHLQHPSLAVLNSDIPLLEKARAHVATKADRVLTAGKSPEADVRLLSVERAAGETRVTALLQGRELQYRLRSEGDAIVANSLTALACVAGLGCDIDKAISRLETFEPVPGRARVHSLTIEGKNIRVLDDSFNATAISVASCLDHLKTLALETGGRKIAVLGDIRHLGHRSAQIHTNLAAKLIENQVDRIYTMGDEAKHLQAALPSEMRAGHYAEHKDLLDALVSDLRENDTIAIKASMPLRFGQFVKSLREMSHPN